MTDQPENQVSEHTTPETRTSERTANLLKNWDKLAAPEAPKTPEETPPESEPAEKPEPDTKAEAQSSPASEPPKTPEDEVPERTWQAVLKANKETISLKKENQALKAQLKEIDTFKESQKQYQGVQEFINEFKQDKFAALEKYFGDDIYESWSARRQAKAEGKDPPVELTKYEQRIAALEKERQAERQLQEQREQQALIDNYTKQLLSHVSQDKFFERRGGVERALKICHDHIQATNEILDAKTAASLAQKEIQQELDDEMALYQSIRKQVVDKKEEKKTEKVAAEPELDDDEDSEPRSKTKKSPKQTVAEREAARMKRAKNLLGDF